MGTEHLDYEQLGKSVAKHLREAHQDGGCPMGWTSEDTQTLRDFAASLRSAKATAWTTLIGIVVVGGVGLLVGGFWRWAHSQGP